MSSHDRSGVIECTVFAALEISFGCCYNTRTIMTARNLSYFYFLKYAIIMFYYLKTLLRFCPVHCTVCAKDILLSFIQYFSLFGVYHDNVLLSVFVKIFPVHVLIVLFALRISYSPFIQYCTCAYLSCFCFLPSYLLYGQIGLLLYLLMFDPLYFCIILPFGKLLLFCIFSVLCLP